MGTSWHCLILVTLTTLLIACNNQTGTSQAAETSASDNAALDAPPYEDTPVYDLQRGKTVFTDKCLHCHGEGVYDAPRLGNAADWEARVRQPLAVLITHAIQGHGRMPPKGGFMALSDTEVRDAVAYVVGSSKKIILALKRQQYQQDCHPVRAPEKCEEMDAADVLTLQMLWLLGAPGRQ
jgi:cytochrome c5